jgi:hypothetical protein
MEAMEFDLIMRRWPGYTISSILAEDADLLIRTLELMLLYEGDDGNR